MATEGKRPPLHGLSLVVHIPSAVCPPSLSGASKDVAAPVTAAVAPELSLCCGFVEVKIPTTVWSPISQVQLAVEGLCGIPPHDQVSSPTPVL
jgi:hypothetical protein